MKAFACIVLLAAAALAAPEGKRDKRGYLLGHGYDDHHFDSYHSLDHGLALSSYSHFDHFDHAPIVAHSPIIAHAPAKIVSINKVVEIPKVVEVKKVVSVPKVVSFPQVVKVSKIVSEPHISYGSSYGSGWW